MDVERILAATEDIITPVAVVDEEIVERNLARMAKLAADHNVKLRPHAKTHKSAYMAQRQMAHGAVGHLALRHVGALVRLRVRPQLDVVVGCQLGHSR